MVEITGLRKTYGRRFPVLKGLDLQIEPGKIYALMGPNGSGKTTLAKCILGLINPSGGRVRYDGSDIDGRWAYRKNLAYMSQIARFPDQLTISEFLRLLKDIREEWPDDQEFLKAFGLLPEAEKKLGKLSGGTRQKVNVIQALMFRSSLLICDEPTVGLDAVSLQILKQYMKDYSSNGGSILLITHISPLVEELADELIFLQDGLILYQGTTGGLMNAYGLEKLEPAIATMVKQGEAIS